MQRQQHKSKHHNPAAKGRVALALGLHVAEIRQFGGYSLVCALHSGGMYSVHTGVPGANAQPTRNSKTWEGKQRLRRAGCKTVEGRR